MRVGTWNLKLCPDPTYPRGREIAAWLDAQRADIWLLTEVHRDWDPRGGRFIVSPPRTGAEDVKRWAGIHTRWPVGGPDTIGDSDHPGEEALCLARLELDGTAPSVLVACSVLPWRGAGQYWPGLPGTGQVADFSCVLDHHVARIVAERRPHEPLIWGGDFNQPLTPPYDGFTYAGAAALREAFDAFGLVALTEQVRSLNGASCAIDHLAVSAEVVEEPVAEVHRPTWDGGQLSDHAAYTAGIRLPGESASTEGAA